MRLVITAEIDPKGMSITEARARVKGHLSVIRDLIREGGPTSGVGIESYVLAKPFTDENPRITRIDVRVEP